MVRCDTCLANKVCDHGRFSFENCGFYIHAEDYAVLKRTGERYAQVKEYIDHIILDGCDYSDGIAYENAFRNELDKLLKNKGEVAGDVLEEIEKEMFARIPVEILKPIGADLDFEDGIRLGKRDAIHEVLNFIGRLKKKYGVW